MAGRTADISTSSFKPLSLDEIMTVPLAKQKQEDQANLVLDDLSLIEQNSLDIDKDYVGGQVAAFQNEAAALADQIATKGVDRNLINKTRRLRARKNQEFSIQGKTGRANAAYNEQKANEAAIMARKDLTAEQKRLGLAEAKKNYLGTVADGKYENYIGAAYQPIMEKAVTLGAKMTPEMVAHTLGIKKDEDTGMWIKGDYSSSTLTPEDISQATYLALKSDPAVMEYVNEMERLNPNVSAEQLLRDATASAGQVGQVSKTDTKSTVLSSGLQAGLVDPKKGQHNNNEGWDTLHLDLGEGVWDRTSGLPRPEDINQGKIFDANGKMTPQSEVDASEAQRKTSIRKTYEAAQGKTDSYFNAWERAGLDVKLDDDTWAQERQRQTREGVEKIRENYPELSVKSEDGKINATDQQIYNAYANGQKAKAKTYGTVISAKNLGNAFNNERDILLGTGESNGTFAHKHMQTPGHASGRPEVVAHQLGFEDMAEFNAAMRKGQVMGIAPSHAEMPGAYAVSIELPESFGDDKGQAKIIYVKNDGNVTKSFSGVDQMNKAITNGIDYDDTLPTVISSGGVPLYQTITTDLDVPNERFEAFIVRSSKPVSRDQLKEYEGTWKPIRTKNNDKAWAPFVDGKYVPNIIRLSQHEEIQRSTNAVRKMYDNTLNDKFTRTDLKNQNNPK